MKKKILLLGALILLSTGVMADGEDRIRDMKISKNIVNNAGSMKVNGIYKNINPTEEGYLSGKEYREAILESTLGALDDTYTVIKNNKLQVNKNDLAISSNGDLIAKNTTDLAIHKEEALARDEKINVAISDLKVTDGKVNTAIGRLEDADKKFAETDGKLLATDEKLIQTDKDLKEADEKINANIATLHKHDDAVYETVGVTRDGSGTEIKAVKADVNRAMINNLQRTAEDDIATNKAKTEENEGKIAINSQQIDQALELADNNSEHIEKNSKRIDGLEKKVDGLESKMNKGLAMAAATSSIVYPHLGRGDVGIGAGIGGYGGSQAIAIGVAMQPTENVRINTNVSTSDTSDTMYGAGVGYKFNIFGS